MEVSEENPEVESLTKAPPKEFLEKIQRQKMKTKIDADIAAKLVIGSKIAPKRRRTRRKETMKIPLQALVKSHKISMEQELQTCSMELQTYMWRVMKRTTS